MGGFNDYAKERFVMWCFPTNGVVSQELGNVE
jgi:hypothetical protein